jgi:hypothetical protein
MIPRKIPRKISIRSMKLQAQVIKALREAYHDSSAQARMQPSGDGPGDRGMRELGLGGARSGNSGMVRPIYSSTISPTPSGLKRT